MEMLVYLALLGTVLSVVYSIYYQFSRTLSAADRTMLKERSCFAAVRAMQDDIRRSNEVLDSFGPFNGADGALILLIGQLEAPGGEIVIYRLAESENTLVRSETKVGGQSRGLSSRNVGFDVREFGFSMDESGVNLLRVSVLVKEGPLGVLRNRPLTFSAHMRNG